MSAADLTRHLESKRRVTDESLHDLDTSDVDKVADSIKRHFRGARIEVTRTYPDGETYTRRGRVGITAGWRPALLLMHRVSDTGSSDLLDERDVFVKVVSA